MAETKKKVEFNSKTKKWIDTKFSDDFYLAIRDSEMTKTFERVIDKFDCNMKNSDVEVMLKDISDNRGINEDGIVKINRKPGNYKQLQVSILYPSVMRMDDQLNIFANVNMIMDVEYDCIAKDAISVIVGNVDIIINPCEYYAKSGSKVSKRQIDPIKDLQLKDSKTQQNVIGNVASMFKFDGSNDKTLGTFTDAIVEAIERAYKKAEKKIKHHTIKVTKQNSNKKDLSDVGEILYYI